MDDLGVPLFSETSTCEKLQDLEETTAGTGDDRNFEPACGLSVCRMQLPVQYALNP